MQHQQKDKELIKIAQTGKDYFLQNFHGGDKKYSLICKNFKIVIPKQLENHVVEWCHNALSYPRVIRTKLSITQYFYWKNSRQTVYEICSKYKAYHFLKRNKKQYGKPPPKGAESISWDTLCEDPIGKYQVTPKGGGKKSQIIPTKGDEKKYKMTTKSGKSVYLQAVTMFDPTTGLIEIHTVPSARTDLVANQVELTWLTRY